MALQSVQVVGVQPGMVMSQINMKTERWRTGICDCCEDMNLCCLGFWCPPCLACQVSSEAGECLCLPLLDMLWAGIIPGAHLALRSSLRERYRIQGTIANDCCIATFCPICSWCQMGRELKLQRNITIMTASPAVMQVAMHSFQQSPYPQQPSQPLAYAPQPSQPLVYAPQPSQPLVYAPQPSQPLAYAPQPSRPPPYTPQPPHASHAGYTKLTEERMENGEPSCD